MFNLTRQEKHAILFIAILSFLGIGIDFLAKTQSRVKSIFYNNLNLGKININQADKQSLLFIPGIGEKLAQRIIQYRMEHGNFQDMQELKKVKGVTDYRLQKITKSSFAE